MHGAVICHPANPSSDVLQSVFTHGEKLGMLSLQNTALKGSGALPDGFIFPAEVCHLKRYPFKKQGSKVLVTDKYFGAGFPTVTTPVRKQCLSSSRGRCVLLRAFPADLILLFPSVSCRAAPGWRQLEIPWDEVDEDESFGLFDLETKHVPQLIPYLAGLQGSQRRKRKAFCCPPTTLDPHLPLVDPKHFQ